MRSFLKREFTVCIVNFWEIVISNCKSDGKKGPFFSWYYKWFSYVDFVLYICSTVNATFKVRLSLKDNESFAYSRVPNKCTGCLLNNDKKSASTFLSPNKQKNLTFISFFSPKKFDRSSHTYNTVWNYYKSIRDSRDAYIYECVVSCTKRSKNLESYLTNNTYSRMVF